MDHPTTNEEWEALYRQAEQPYKPGVRVTSLALPERSEIKDLIYNLSAYTVDLAQLGASGTKARARVRKGGETIYEIEEGRTETVVAKLNRYLAQKVQTEAARLAR